MATSGQQRQSTDHVPAQPLSSEILTIPNILSLLRLVGIPVFLWLVLVIENDVAAVALLLASAFSDWLDGVLARRLGQITRLGQILDPLADRLYIFATLAGLLFRDIVPWWFVALIIARDAVLTLLLPPLRHYGYGPLQVNFVGKTGAFCLFLAFPLLLLGDQYEFANPLGWALGLWGMGLYWLAGVLYIRQFITIIGQARKEPA
ncbi:MAG: CDP-alcohol phosphatidyltransferase family protein [Corynebacteriales bacterium]|nr:CDP-alcohol phosphatidyltransferase family protein [Mycobacteriales bacterium]